jgi:serine/threonine protein kinase
MPDDHRPYDAEAPAPQQPGPGFRIGEYSILETLGHGSMATVYRARDATEHDVAIKIFQEGPGVSPTLLERFRREAEASKKLRRHPHIMKVYATGREGAYHYIVMEPIRNSRTLDDLMHGGSAPVGDLVGIAIKIARALHYAHSRNIVHRDVKPTNIMIDEFGEPMLTDFGVAALIDWPSCTITGALTGTPLYMSPEQARSDRTGPASDIYSLGVVLYEALTGVLPYSTQHSAPVKSVLEAVRHEAPRRPRSIRRDLSPDLEAVILKALAKDPAHRYPDAEAFANDLERAIEGRPVSARLFSRWEHIRVFVRRYDQPVATVLVLALMLALAGLYFRRQLLAAQYDKLVNIVRLRNYALGTAVDGAQGAGGAGWAGIRAIVEAARTDVRRRRYDVALKQYQDALKAMASGESPPRSVAQVHLEMAQCLAAKGETDRALEAYRTILSNADWPDPPAGQAHLDALLLALLANDLEAAEKIRALRSGSPPRYGPLRDAVRCLEGRLSAEDLEKAAPYMPGSYRNDVYLAAAVRHRLDGRSDLYRRALDRFGREAWNWPAPLVERLRRTDPSLGRRE